MERQGRFRGAGFVSIHSFLRAWKTYDWRTWAALVVLEQESPEGLQPTTDTWLYGRR